jgi:hypothetical protein
LKGFLGGLDNKEDSLRVKEIKITYPPFFPLIIPFRPHTTIIKTRRRHRKKTESSPDENISTQCSSRSTQQRNKKPFRKISLLYVIVQFIDLLVIE